MALLVTVPWQLIPATIIQNGEMAERRDRPGRNIIIERNWELEVSEMLQHLMMKRTYKEQKSLQATGTLFALSSS